MNIHDLRIPDSDELTIARRWLQDGTMSQDAYLTWAMAEAGLSHRAIADYRRRSKGTITETITHWRRRIREEIDGKDRTNQPPTHRSAGSRP